MNMLHQSIYVNFAINDIVYYLTARSPVYIAKYCAYFNVNVF